MNFLKQVDAAHIPNKTKHPGREVSNSCRATIERQFYSLRSFIGAVQRVRQSMRERAASLAVALGATVVLTTGCSSIGSGFGARLINQFQIISRLPILKTTVGTNHRAVLDLILICAVN